MLLLLLWLLICVVQSCLFISFGSLIYSCVLSMYVDNEDEDDEDDDNDNNTSMVAVFVANANSKGDKQQTVLKHVYCVWLVVCCFCSFIMWCCL